MKDVLIIGGGPVGLTLANELSETLTVTVITPNHPLKFKSTPESQFKLSPHSTSGELFGNSRFWGSQHEGLENTKVTSPIFSDLPGFTFDLKELEKYEERLLRQGWPSIKTFENKPDKIFNGINRGTYYKGKSFEPLPRKLSKKIKFITTEFENLHFTLDSSKKLESLTIDRAVFKADVFVFAAGGLSNIALLQKLSRECSSHKKIELKMLGVGYSNHPKTSFLRVRFHRPRYFGGLWSFRKYKKMDSWDFDDTQSEPRPLRVSARIWPMYARSTWSLAMASRLLRIFGFYIEAQVVLYIELPQISQNFVKFEMQKNRQLDFYFNYNFPSEMEKMLQANLDQIEDYISSNSTLKIIQREDLSLKQILLDDTNHHFGGTRMANNSEHGVVDSFSRCFEISNLFILGTSTLPISTFLHPTLISAALALRAAEEIKSNE